MSMVESTRRPRHAPRARGFTLIEIVTVMVLVSALAAVAAVFIVQPFQASSDMATRARLTDTAETALNQIAREVRRAVPNSVRVDTVNGRPVIELLRTRTGGRYRRLSEPGGGGAALVRAQASGSFDVIGGLTDAARIDDGHPGGRDCGEDTGDCVVIYNTSATDATPYNAYLGGNVAGVTAADSGSVSYDAGSAPAFPADSPDQRFSVMDTPVSYVCDPDADNTLTRHTDYGLQNAPSDTPGGSDALLARQVTDCDFRYVPGTATRNGLLTLEITLSDAGERVHLLMQAHVLNAP